MIKPAVCSVDFRESKIEYRLLRTRRRSLEIAVHPDGKVVVRAPLSCSLRAVEERVKNRAAWIRRKIKFFESFPQPPQPCYADGERHPYLGRRHRLKIKVSARDGVLLKNGCFAVECRENRPERVRELLDAWYRSRALALLPEMFDRCWKEFSRSGFAGDFPKPFLRLRKMKTRWGSMSSSGGLTLNTELVKKPARCVEYVIVHELCHLSHHNHGRGFYRLMERVMPDWKARKRKLDLL